MSHKNELNGHDQLANSAKSAKSFLKYNARTNLPRPQLRPYLLGLLASICLLAYQNCVKELPGGAAAPNSNINSSTTHTVPFAFDAVMDRIGYLSCPTSTNLSNDTYFQFRIGAFNVGSGLRLSSWLASYATTHGLGRAGRADLYYNHPANRNAKLQLAIRPSQSGKSNLQNPAKGPTSAAFGNTGWTNLFDGTLAERIIDGDQIRLLPHIGQLALTYGLTEMPEESFRSTFEDGTHALVVGYDSETNSNRSVLRSAHEFDVTQPVESFFGRGYSPAFKAPTRNFTESFNPGMPNRVLSDIVELNFESGTPKQLNVVWNCFVPFQFRVVPPSQTSEAGCSDTNTTPDIQSLTPDEASAYSAADTLLNLNGIKKWHIDPKNRCIIPVESTAANTCYAAAGNYGEPNIEWNPAQACGSTGSKVCPHFFSICQR
ncbi:MAG: hypothetical protein COT74_05135 [Bdellovibrionales bacterium CG10_big_fil_rev_8_21_14_0_10_45_34]|nr:MAG: hypothetical protein COT74_05135 [Bdellovibrionales bacterium CG10_big_fil_rev_8_21_14_0_10_45_34]